MKKIGNIANNIIRNPSGSFRQGATWLFVIAVVLSYFLSKLH